MATTIVPLMATPAAGRIETALAARETEHRGRLLDFGLAYASKAQTNGLVLFDRRGRLVRADMHASQSLAALGATSGPDDPIRIEALDITTDDPVRPALPAWLQADWLKPVNVDHERLGTALVLPGRYRRIGALPQGGLPAYRLRRAKEFIENQIDKPIRLEQIAAAAGVSRYHFHRLFKQSTGITPHRYVLEVRIEHAKALLSRTELPLVEIAARTGFQDQSHFTRVFRRMTSMTPRIFRNTASS